MAFKNSFSYFSFLDLNAFAISRSQPTTQCHTTTTFTNQRTALADELQQTENACRIFNFEKSNRILCCSCQVLLFAFLWFALHIHTRKPFSRIKYIIIVRFAPLREMQLTSNINRNNNHKKAKLSI